MRWNRASIRKISLLLFACLVLAPVLLIYLASPPDPTYDGRKLSEHLARLYRPRPTHFTLSTPQEFAQYRAEMDRFILESQESRRALHNKIGEEAFPLLCEWLRANPPPWRKPIEWLRKQFKVRVPISPLDRGVAAALAINQFELKDPRFIPLLRERLAKGERNGADVVAMALARNIQALTLSQQQREALVKELIATLATIQANTAPGNRFNEHVVERCIALCDLDASLRNLVMLEVGSPGHRIGAAMFFIDNPILPDRAIPLLLANLSSTNASVLEYSSKALAAYGPSAGSAVAELSKLATHPKERVASAARSAIQAIKQAERDETTVP